LVDVLCGPLAGSAWSLHISGARGAETPAMIGHTFMAWRIDAFRDPAAFHADLRTMLGELRATPPASGHEATGVLIPGDPEIAAEAVNRRDGLPIRREVLAELRVLADELGLPFSLEQGQ
jgi:L-2-hydroxycarboxylate dehydrogenase (NAD+)